MLRDLNAYLYEHYDVPNPEKWFWEHDRKDIFQWVELDDHRILLDAPETEYCPVIRTYVDKPDIWTSQPLIWREYTLKWVKKHFGCSRIRFLSTKEKRERLDFLTDTILIEDSPQFAHYNRIILVDRPYNKHISADRIKTPGELIEVCRRQRTEQHRP